MSDFFKKITEAYDRVVEAARNWVSRIIHGKPEGTFEKTTTSGKRIDFHFELFKEGEYEIIYVVSIFCIKEDATGEIIIPYVRGCQATFDPLLGKPDPKSAVGGYVVDAPERKFTPAGLNTVPNTSPHVDNSNFDGKKTLTANDEPRFVRGEHTAYFETYAAKLEGKKYKILGCMRWKNTTVPEESTIIYNGSSKDWWPPRLEYVAALKKWMRNNAI